jgi:hypothetical protein
MRAEDSKLFEKVACKLFLSCHILGWEFDWVVVNMQSNLILVTCFLTGSESCAEVSG